jgi:hypothetical protein
MYVVHFRNRRLKTTLGVFTAAALVLSGGAAAIAGSGSAETYIPELGVTVPAEKAGPISNMLRDSGATESGVDAPAPSAKPDPIPAAMLSEDTPIPISPMVIQVTNAWLVSDGLTLVAVYAGSAGEDSKLGRFVIVRQDWRIGEQTQEVVDAGPGGSVKITSAPLGDAVVKSAQTGDLEFQANDGTVGVLHLSSDAISKG